VAATQARMIRSTSAMSRRHPEPPFRDAVSSPVYGTSVSGYCPSMRLRDFFDPDAVALDVAATDKPAVLGALVGLLRLDDRSSHQILRLLERREQLGSTGFGRGLAIPHCRSLAVQRLRAAFGRLRTPVEFGAADHRPVSHVFLIVAPPLEVSNQYLPVLGRIAQLGKTPELPQRLGALRSTDDFFALLDETHA
jgi:mannitol/fructose-specific phosphotransferase system IIA component (Ntr-type)